MYVHKRLVNDLFVFTQAGLDLEIGVVQTAYANGSSTKYLEDTMKVRKECVSFISFCNIHMVYDYIHTFPCDLGESELH